MRIFNFNDKGLTKVTKMKVETRKRLVVLMKKKNNFIKKQSYLYVRLENC